MSHVFSVYDGPQPRTFDEAMNALEALDSAFESYVEPTPKIVAFVEALLSRWPDITDDGGESSPWSDGPMANNAAGGVIHVGVVYSMLEEAQRFLVDTARGLQLVLVDQAEGQVLVPDGVSIQPDEQSVAAPQRRRWFRRG